MNKDVLRNQLKAIRKNIENKADKDVLINSRILEFIKNERDVLVYLSAYTEVETLNLCKILLKNKVNVYAPKCIDDRTMIFCKVESLNQLKKSKYGIFEPIDNMKVLQKLENPICLVPGLGFDLNGYRIGYGKAYYDTFLRKNKVKSVGVCYSEQIVNEIPKEKHDKQLEFLITDKFTKEIFNG
ncbi:MAG: 5-formyltetrahydrofolate cyclo-ligase [Clostridia bacterium]